ASQQDRPPPPTTPKTSDGHNAVPDELQEEPQLEQHLCSAAFLPWQERRERSDAAARSNSEQRKREYVESAPQHQERLAAQMTALQSVFQTAISEDWQHHACVSGATRLEDSPLKPLQVMQVEYISMQDRFKLTLPCYECASCNQSISPNPLSFFCWPSSQTHAQTRFDVRVLRSYARMQGSGAGGHPIPLPSYLPPVHLSAQPTPQPSSAIICQKDCSAWAAAAASFRCVAVQVAAGCGCASVHEQQQQVAVHVLQSMSSSSSKL
ncbi:hypothetical protein QJQ45_014174, partial [Haematococcus lacustris]